MMPLNPSSVIAAAKSFIGFGEEGGENRGQVVDAFLREVGQPVGLPWCAAFVYHVGYWSHYDARTQRSAWPLPRTASCFELGQFARDNGVLLKEPREGDVFLCWFPELKRFAHTGVVVSVDQCTGDATDPVYLCTTVEGNTNVNGSRDGRFTLQKSRRFAIRNGDRFIRWANLAREQRAA